MEFVPIVKPVGGRCNLFCRYCYFLQKQNNKGNAFLMNDSILRALIDQTCGGQDKVEFIWHGGEPLLAGIKFYQRVLEFEMPWIEKDKEIYNSIQTNGILINEKWIEFFKQNNFFVSISIDGPQEFHDQVRRDLKGNGTFKQVLRNIKLLQKAGILSGVICCVSKVNCSEPRKIFDFFITEDVKEIKFLQVQGRDVQGRLFPYSVNPIDYVNFLLEIMKAWLELDDPTIKITEIDSIIKTMLGGEVEDCMFGGTCQKYFTVYPNGFVYGCDSLPRIENLRFGHILEGVEKIVSCGLFKKFCQRLDEIKNKCRDCEWFKSCHGGCLQDYHPDIFNLQTRNLFCPALKKMFKEINRILKEYGLV